MASAAIVPVPDRVLPDREVGSYDTPRNDNLHSPFFRNADVTRPPVDVEIDIYISEPTYNDYTNTKNDFLVDFQSATNLLTEAVNLAMGNEATSEIYRFIPTFQMDPPGEVNLDVCGVEFGDISQMLTTIFRSTDKSRSAIAVTPCNFARFEPNFLVAGQNIPYVTQSVSGVCITMNLVPLEYEKEKFIAVAATALLKSAGVQHPSPIRVLQISNKDDGVTYAIELIDGVAKELTSKKCKVPLAPVYL